MVEQKTNSLNIFPKLNISQSKQGYTKMKKTWLLLFTFGALFSGSLKAETPIQKQNTIFFQKNSQQKGVKQTESGLQYRVHKQGKGANIQLGDTVKVRYIGKLLNGKVFDKGEFDFIFQDGMVIEGWTEGLQLMKQGGRYTLYIPADLAYGEMSPSPDIPDNAALIFHMNIVSVQAQGSLK